MKPTFTVLLPTFLYFSINVAFGQQSQEPPKTKLETFVKQEGPRLIEGFTELGTINGMVGRLDIQASEFISPLSNTKAYGIVITLRTAIGSNSSIFYIDYDEIDGVIAGLDFLDKTNKTVTKLDNVNATYQTRGGLMFHIYTRDNGNVNLLIASGRYSSMAGNFRKTDIAQISALMLKAKEKLDSIE